MATYVGRNQSAASRIGAAMGAGAQKGIVDSILEQRLDARQADHQTKINADMGTLMNAMADDSGGSVYDSLFKAAPNINTPEGAEALFNFAQQTQVGGIKANLELLSGQNDLLVKQLELEGKAPKTFIEEDIDENGDPVSITMQWDPQRREYYEARRRSKGKVEKFGPIVDRKGQAMQQNLATKEWKAIGGRGTTVNIGDKVSEGDLAKVVDDKLVTKAVADTTLRMNDLLPKYSRYLAGEDVSVNDMDQAIIIAFNKLKDPTSVVRESEYLRSAQGQSVLDRLSGWFSKGMEGGSGLSADERRLFMQGLMEGYRGLQDRYVEGTRRERYTALRNGLNLGGIVESRFLRQDQIDDIYDANDIAENPEYFRPSVIDDMINNILGGEADNNVTGDGNTDDAPIDFNRKPNESTEDYKKRIGLGG